MFEKMAKNQKQQKPIWPLCEYLMSRFEIAEIYRVLTSLFHYVRRGKVFSREKFIDYG